MKRAYGYIRVSTDFQAESGYSLDNQKRAIKDYSKTRGLQLLHIYVDEGKSGRTVRRPEFQEMLKQIREKGIDSVLIYKIDRFARNVTDFSRIWNEFKANNINLISVLEGDLSNGSSLVPNIFASVAQWESEVNSQRTKDALMQKFVSGWQPTPPCLGYRSVGGDGERKTCEPDPHSAPIIKKMFQLYSTGEYSMQSLQEWLKDKNIISKSGGMIGFSTIDGILNNPFFYGLIRWRGQSKIGKHIPLITKQLFEACKYILAKHRNFLVRERKYDFLLRGFVRCCCGTRLIGEKHKIRSNNKTIDYYHCQRRYSVDCRQPYVQSKELEKQIENAMKNFELSDEFIKKLITEAEAYLDSGKKDVGSMNQALVNQKTGLDLRRNRLEDLLIDGSIDKDTYKRKHEAITEQIDNLQTQIESVEQENTLDLPLVKDTLSLTQNLYSTFKSASPPVKRHYLRFFYESFIVKDKVLIESKPTPILESIFDANMVRLRKTQLPREDSNF